MTPGREFKPLENWTAGDLRDEYNDAKTNGQKARQTWLTFALNPKLSAAVRNLLRGEAEAIEDHFWGHAERLKASDAADRYLLYKTARWFLRRFSIWRSGRLYCKLGLRGDPAFLVRLSEMLMLRLVVSVWIGMLAVCGSSPWPVLNGLTPAGLAILAGSTGGFAVAVRSIQILGRSDCHWWWAFSRAFFLAAWGWIWAAAIVWAGRFLITDSAIRCWIEKRYWFLLPSIGSALGVIVQELWQEKPISEPV